MACFPVHQFDAGRVDEDVVKSFLSTHYTCTHFSFKHLFILAKNSLLQCLGPQGPGAVRPTTIGTVPHGIRDRGASGSAAAGILPNGNLKMSQTTATIQSTTGYIL